MLPLCSREFMYLKASFVYELGHTFCYYQKARLIMLQEIQSRYQAMFTLSKVIVVKLNHNALRNFYFSLYY